MRSYSEAVTKEEIKNVITQPYSDYTSRVASINLYSRCQFHRERSSVARGSKVSINSIEMYEEITTDILCDILSKRYLEGDMLHFTFHGSISKGGESLIHVGNKDRLFLERLIEIAYYLGFKSISVLACHAGAIINTKDFGSSRIFSVLQNHSELFGRDEEFKIIIASGKGLSMYHPDSYYNKYYMTREIFDNTLGNIISPEVKELVYNSVAKVLTTFMCSIRGAYKVSAIRPENKDQLSEEVMP